MGMEPLWWPLTGRFKAGEQVLEGELMGWRGPVCCEEGGQVGVQQDSGIWAIQALIPALMLAACLSLLG